MIDFLYEWKYFAGNRGRSDGILKSVYTDFTFFLEFQDGEHIWCNEDLHASDLLLTIMIFKNREWLVLQQSRVKTKTHLLRLTAYIEELNDGMKICDGFLFPYDASINLVKSNIL